MIRGEDAVVAMAVLPRRWHEVGEAVEKLAGREVDDAVLSGAGGRAPAARSDPLAALVAGQRAADAFAAAVVARVKGEPLEREGGPGKQLDA